MKFLEDKLEALDIYFAPKKESEKWVVILGVAAVIGYLGYAYLLPYTENLFKKSERSKKSLQKSIKDNNTYLKSITVGGDREYYIKKFDNDMVVKNKKIAETTNKIKFIDTNLQKLSGMLFNEKAWSKFLNSITNKAEIQNVDLQYITNKYIDEEAGSFGHVLEIGIGCKGEYKNIVKFMNELEQNVLVTDIFKTEFSSESDSSQTVADIHISVWGINH
jgi:hypothetical protein